LGIALGISGFSFLIYTWLVSSFIFDILTG
jgi:hypothetical protein